MKDDGTCKNHYSKQFCAKTTVGKDSYPLYMRRDNAQKVTVRGAMLDNRWVVPYNPYLLAKFNCHMNVEICSTIKAVKYLYKYVYKGHDRVAFHISSDENTIGIDEIQSFQNARWISPPEAIWRIYSFILNEMRPAVVALQLHLEHKQPVTFRNSDDLSNIISNEFVAKTMLTEYFTTNKANNAATKYLYNEFPEFFVWDQQKKIWNSRKQAT